MTPLPIQTYTVETVMLDRRGEVVRRVSGQVQRVVIDLGAGVGLPLVAVPAGSFQMGSRGEGGYADERPVHAVFIAARPGAEELREPPAQAARGGLWQVIRERVRGTAGRAATGQAAPGREGAAAGLVELPVTGAAGMAGVAFWMGQGPVTQAQWQAVMGRLPGFRFHGADLPVENICWGEAVAFCDRLARRCGLPFRLPSEAEWEYACRAGTLTPFSFGETITTDYANYVGDHTFRDEPRGAYRHVLTPAGDYPPNPWGLFDMHGGVWEFCADEWFEDYSGAPADGSPRGSGGRFAGRQADWQAGQQADWQAGQQDEWQTGQQDEWQTGRQAGRQAGRFTGEGGEGERHCRVARGGSWHEPPLNCRSAVRLRVAEDDRAEYYGLRVLC